MKNCYKCEMLKINYGKLNYDGYNENCRIFKCGRNSSKTFNDPELHGWFCRHYANKVVKNDNKR